MEGREIGVVRPGGRPPDTFEHRTAAVEPTDDDHVMVKVDDHKKVIGFAVFDLTTMKGHPISVTLKAPAPAPKMLTTREEAEEPRLTQGRLRHLLSDGRIVSARRIGRDWIIPAPVMITSGARGPLGAAG